MDTISRENNSYLPVAGALLGGLAVILSAAALIQLSGVKNSLKGDKDALNSKIESVESASRNSVTVSEKAAKDIASLARQTQDAFTQVGGELGKINTELTKMAEAKTTKAPAKGAVGKGDAGPKEPAVAGSDEYVVKGGDTGSKIAKANGVSLKDLEAVNPSVNWSKLKVGDKVKLPKKA